MIEDFERSIELVAQYRELISRVEEGEVSGADLRTEAESLWSTITESFAKIPAGHEDLNTNRLTVRGFAFPFRAKKLVFKNGIAEYSQKALARELLGWDSSSTISDNEEDISSLVRDSEWGVNEDARLLFQQVFDPLHATPEHPIAYVDLETTGPHPSVSEIIECGMVVDYGTHEDEYDELYSLKDERAIRNGKLPYADCHHIDPEMIGGKKTWDEANEIHSILADPSVTVVAHNLSFEAHWFAHTVPDFMRNRSPYFAEAAGSPDQARMFDTRMAAAFISNAESGTLQSLVEAGGDSYIDAHRALNDVKMMKKAVKTI